MTWKEFKEAVEVRGVKDEDTLAYIDWSSDRWGREPVRVDREAYLAGYIDVAIT